MSKYQNENVTVLRDAKEGDNGFVANTDQILIRCENGTEKVVKRSEATGQ